MSKLPFAETLVVGLTCAFAVHLMEPAQLTAYVAGLLHGMLIFVTVTALFRGLRAISSSAPASAYSAAAAKEAQTPKSLLKKCATLLSTRHSPRSRARAHRRLAAEEPMRPMDFSVSVDQYENMKSAKKRQTPKRPAANPATPGSRRRCSRAA